MGTFLFLKQHSNWKKNLRFSPEQQVVTSPSRCEGNMNSSITSDHIVSKEVRSVDAHYNLWPCK